MFETTLDTVETEKASGGRAVDRLRVPLKWRLSLNGKDGIKVTVPAGFETDYASVPRLAWPLFPPRGPWSKAAVIHDYLCSNDVCSRPLADAIFREIMRELGVPRWRRAVMYVAVRAYSILIKRK